MTLTLNNNAVLAGLLNMIISQQVFSDAIRPDSLFNDFRVDGTFYGDKKLFYSTDILRSFNFNPKNNKGNGGMSYNLMTEFLPEDPEVDEIEVTTFRQIPLTLDRYRTKQAFMSESIFGEFISNMQSRMRDTKAIYNAALTNCFIGTKVSSVVDNNISVTLETPGSDATSVEKESINRLNALTIGQSINDLIIDLEDFSRKFNEYKFMRTYEKSDFIIIWNSKKRSKYRNVDLPSLYHNDGTLKFGMTEKYLHPRFFGTKLSTVTQANTLTAKVFEPELDYKCAGDDVHAFGGESLKQGTYSEAELLALANKVYLPNDKVIAKIVHKDALKIMSGFEMTTEFYNPQTLRTNNYITWGHSTLKTLKEFPWITVSET